MGSLVTEPVDVLSEDQLAEVRGLYEDAFPAQLRVLFPELPQTGPVDFIRTEPGSRPEED